MDTGGLITMDVDQCELKLDQLHDGGDTFTDHERSALEAAYKAGAEGLRVIDINKAIVAGGFDDQERPNLAFSRADFERIHLHVSSYSFSYRRWSTKVSTWDSRLWSHLVLLERSGQPMPISRASALVPPIPPGVRKRGMGRLRDLYILWEADWEAVPVDPILLRHIAGTLYAILAEWDLTEIERAVLSERL